MAVATTGHYKDIFASLEYSYSPSFQFLKTCRLLARKRLPENYRNLSIFHRPLRQSINDAPYLAAVISAMAYASCPPAVDLALPPIVLETNDVKMQKDTRAADLIFGSVCFFDLELMIRLQVLLGRLSSIHLIQSRSDYKHSPSINLVG